MSDTLILVNEKDESVGFCEKVKCHMGEGLRHRAFSIFIFNKKGEILIQKRSEKKMLWPLYWSNTCCSHPRKNEDIQNAIHRRLYEEMGLKSRLYYVFKFRYKAKYKNIGSENEFCSVFAGKFYGSVRPNSDEIAEWKFIKINDLITDVKKNPRKYTPWFKIELKKFQAIKFNINKIKI